MTETRKIAAILAADFSALAGSPAPTRSAFSRLRALRKDLIDPTPARDEQGLAARHPIAPRICRG